MLAHASRVCSSSLAIILISITISLLIPATAYTQNASNPVQVTSNLIPPYSLYLSDYSDASQNKWNIQLLLKDFTQTNYQAKLRITIEGAGIRLRTRQGYSPGPIQLDPGMPYQVDATDLSSYLNIQNMEVSGINRSQLASTQKLPEGFYQFKIEVLDYQRNNKVSNTGSSMAWLVLNDPPLLNLPFEEKLRIQDPQQVQFQWTPRHTSSPNSAFETEYIFKLWEIWPEGRDPNEVARTTQPVFKRTVMNTSYFYGLNDALLIPGRSYAWQVQAVNLTGRDLFKNQGKSEVRWFKYGDECLPINNLGAEALGTDRIRITWEGGWNHNRYVAQIRETGQEEWINYGTNIETQVVYELQSNTAYQIRVIPTCGALEGTSDNTLTLSTPEQELNELDCGAEPNLPTIENRENIENLSTGDRITAAGFTVILTEVIKNGDTYTGMGLIVVPLFNSARVEAILHDIKVNTDKQLIGGRVESTLNPNGPFILDTDEVVEELSEEGTDEQPESEEDSFDELPETDIDIEGEIADVEHDEEGTITVTDTEGNTTEIDPETADENEDGDIVIEDEEGNVYVVDENGEVSGPYNDNPSNPDALAEDATIDYVVQFKASPQQQYGFDSKQYETLAGNYSQTTFNGENYWMAWKSISSGSADPVLAEATGTDEFPEAIGFKNLSTNLGFAPGEEANEKSVSVQTSTEDEEVTAFVLQERTNAEGETEEEQVPVGKLKVKQYDLISNKVVIVPVNDAQVPVASSLQQELNQIYGQAVASWDLNIAEPYEVDSDVLENLNEGESGWLASFPQNMRQFNRDYKRSIEFDNDAYYLFVINEEVADIAGFMPFKRQYGYIYSNNTSNLSKTIAHELGHGAFRLYHTFSDEGYVAARNATDNLMDYKDEGTDLYKHQWDLVHDPEAMVSWLNDDEEGEIGSGGVIDFLKLDDNSKLSLMPEPIKLKYSIENWQDEINQLAEVVDGLSLELSDYHLMVFVTQKEIEEEEGVSFREVVFTEKLQDITSSGGELEWNGEINVDGDTINSSNQGNYALNLGVLHNNHLTANFDSGKFYINEKDENGLQIILENDNNHPIAFIDLIADIEFRLNDSYIEWENSTLDDSQLLYAKYENYKDSRSSYIARLEEIGINTEETDPITYLNEHIVSGDFMGLDIHGINIRYLYVLRKLEERLGRRNNWNSSSDGFKNLVQGADQFYIEQGARMSSVGGNLSDHATGFALDFVKNSNIWVRGPNYNEEVYNYIRFVTGGQLYGKVQSSEESKYYHIDFLEKISITGRDMNSISSIENNFDDFVNFLQLSENKLETDLLREAWIQAKSEYNSDLESILSLEIDSSSFSERKDQIRERIELLLEEVSAITTEFNNYRDALNYISDVLFLRNTHMQLYNEFNDVLAGRELVMLDVTNQLHSFLNSNLTLASWNEDIENHLQIVEQYNIVESNFIEVLNEAIEDKKNLLGGDFTGYSARLKSRLEAIRPYYGSEFLDKGFFSLDLQLVNAIKNQTVNTPQGNVQVKWGGDYGTTKDYMHFEIRPSPGNRTHQSLLHRIEMNDIKNYLNEFLDENGNNYEY